MSLIIAEPCNELTASATVLPLPTSTSNSRSLGMICSASSFFPGGIEYPPLVLTLDDLPWLTTRLVPSWGQRQYLQLSGSAILSPER